MKNVLILILFLFSINTIETQQPDTTCSCYNLILNQESKTYMYKDSILFTGTCYDYYQSGDFKWKMRLELGKPIGTYTQYYRTGNLATEITFNEHESNIIENYYYYSNGSTKGYEKRQSDYYPVFLIENKVKGNLKKGIFGSDFIEVLMEGEYKGWFENGEPKYYFHIEGRKLKDTCEIWNEKGRLFQRVVYKDGEPVGQWESWNKIGEEIAKINFRNGKVNNGNWIFYRDIEKNQRESEFYYSNGKCQMVPYENGWKTNIQNFSEKEIREHFLWNTVNTFEKIMYNSIYMSKE